MAEWMVVTVMLDVVYRRLDKPLDDSLINSNPI
jgi:hypothetical protein